MRERSRELRDRAVWVLARLSLTMLLAMMAAAFMGTAAQGQTTESATVVKDQAPAQVGVLDGASPVGIVLVVLVVVVGLGVLAVGALKPARRKSSGNLVGLLRD